MTIKRIAQLILSLLILSVFKSSFAASLIGSIKENQYDDYFSDAKGIFIDNDGVVYVTSENKGTVLRIHNKKITKNKLTPNVFSDSDLAAVALLKNKSIAVLNNGDSQIAITDLNFNKIRRFSRSGDDAGELDSPVAIAASVNNRLYVADRGNNRISVFNTQGLYLFSFGDAGLSSSRLYNPTHIALDAIENVYVMEAGDRNRISIYTRQGDLLKQIKGDDLKSVFGMTPDFSAMAVDLNGVVYFADEDKRQITALNWFNNSIISSFGSFGNSPGQFSLITQLSINNKSQIAVLDSYNQKVEWFQLEQTKFDEARAFNVISYHNRVSVQCRHVYAFNDAQKLCVKPNERGISIISNEGKEQGFFSDIKAPTHIHVGNTHVSILEDNYLSTYTFDNKKIFKIGRYGISPGGFDEPFSVYGINGLTYVADKNNNRIQVFAKDGLFVKQYKGGDYKDSPFETVGHVAVSSDGKLYVADGYNQSVITISDIATGKRLSSIVLGVDAYAVTNLFNLAMDQKDRLYVFSATNDNPYTVSIWQDENEIHRFGSEKGNGTNGTFEKASSMSVLSTQTNSILINDVEKNYLYTFQYQEVPVPAVGLMVDGHQSSVSLKWAKTSSQIVASYIIEGAKKESGPFFKITEINENKTVLNIADVKNYLWFRVVSLSGYGLKAKPSKAKQNKYQKVAQLFKSKNYDAVIIRGDELLKLFPKNKDLLYLYGRSLLIKNEYRDAITVFKQLAQFNVYKTEALELQVEAYFNLEEYLDAKAVIDDVLELQPKEVHPYLLCVELSLKLGDAIGAVTCAEDGLEQNSKHVKLRYLLGKSYLSAGIAEEALLVFDRIIKSQPNDFSTRLLIANDLYDLKMYEEALQHFSFVVSRQSFSSEAKNGKAKVLIALERYDEAKTLAIALSGNKQSKALQSDGYYFLGQIAFSQRKFTQAILRLTRASKYNAQAVNAWSLLARSYIEINKLSKGVDVLNQAIKKNPNAFELYVTLGKIELEQEHYPQANKALTKAVSLNSTSLDAQKLLAKSLFITRSYNKASVHATQAARIAPKDIDVLSLQADIASVQGKVGSAIDYLRTAISIKPSSADLQYRLGKVYQDANVFDSSKIHLEKSAAINPSWAAPNAALGDLYLKRRLFRQAIIAYEKAIELEPSDNNRAALNVAFSSQKKALEFSNNAPQLVLQDLNLRHIFSAAYKKYLDEAIGQVTLENVGATDYGDLTLSFQIKEYMDFPSIQKVPLIKGSSKQVLDIKAIFNNKILEVDQDTGVQVEVKLSYLRDGQKDNVTLTQAMTIYGKNAMIWNDSAMIGSFVTPKDDTLRNFVREAVNKYQPKPGPVNDKLISAMSYFSSLNAHGTKYIVDPNTPYASLREDQVDYVQFPRETLRLKSGDCDDLSVLYSAGLENLGINTALLEVPGHLLMMFDTGLDVEDANLVSRDLSLLAVKDNRIWIPVETTMINNSFSEAWAEGARKYQKAVSKNNLGIISLKTAWVKYKPVTLKKSDYKISLPEEALTKKLVSRETKILLTKSIDRLILPYQAMVASDPSNILARMQIAILYSRFGLYSDATLAYDELTELAPNNASVFNNKGNFYLLQDKINEALKEYFKAERIDSQDAFVKLNLAMAYYSKGEVNKASAYFQKAVRLDKSIKQQYNAFGKLLSH